MMAEILQDVPERVRDLASGSEDVSVVPVRKDLTAAAGDPVDRARNANAQALHAARQAFGAVRFDEQVQVISLHRVMHDADPEPLLSLADSAEDCLEQSPSPQIPHARERSQRHVHRMARGESLPLEMRDAWLGASWLAACVAPLATPSW